MLHIDEELAEDQLLRLLTSNCEEDYMVAFVLMESIGANRIIQSLLAAIMLAHRERSVYKSAARLYRKFGSPSFLEHVTSCRMSLRGRVDTRRKVHVLGTHPDIDYLTFVLMHGRIASDNGNSTDFDGRTLHVRGIVDDKVPECLRYFSQLKAIVFENCFNLNLEQVLPVLKAMPHLETLCIWGCGIEIPASIGRLTQLIALDISFNWIVDPWPLRNLVNLESLHLPGTMIWDWAWLAALENLQILDLSQGGLTEIPEEVYSLKHLQALDLKENKLTALDERLEQLAGLAFLQCSNNKITEFPCFVGKFRNLEFLSLNSNKIREFDASCIIGQSANLTFPWRRFLLSRNRLKEFSLGEMRFDELEVLDISNNELTVLDDSVFRGTTLREFHADNNRIEAIPTSVVTAFDLHILSLRNNAITSLDEYMSHTAIDQCDLRQNKIRFIDPVFDSGPIDHRTRRWRLANNPIWNMLGSAGRLKAWR